MLKYYGRLINRIRFRTLNKSNNCVYPKRTFRNFLIVLNDAPMEASGNIWKHASNNVRIRYGSLRERNARQYHLNTPIRKSVHRRNKHLTV